MYRKDCSDYRLEFTSLLNLFHCTYLQYVQCTTEVHCKAFPFSLQVNVTKGSVYPSEMRFKREYVLWYKNVFEFLSKGLVPLALLMYLNYQVWAVIRRRRQLEHR